MPVFQITAPDGTKYEVNAPDGASEQDALSYVQSQHGQQEELAPPPTAQTPPAPPSANPQAQQRSLGDRITSNAGDALRFAQKGLLMGAGDVAAAGLAAPIQSLASQFGDNPISLGKAYNNQLAYERQRMDDFQGRNPLIAGVSEGVGGAIPAAGALIASGGAAALPMALEAAAAKTGLGRAGQYAMQNIAKPAVSGAAYGGAYGFGSGRDGLDNRVAAGDDSAIVGGLLGPVAPLIGKSVFSGMDAASKYIGSRFSGGAADDAAAMKVLQSIQRNNPSLSQQEAIQATRDRLTSMGDNAMLADTGENTRALAGAMSRLPGEGKTRINDAVTLRQEGMRDPNTQVLQGGQFGRTNNLIDDLIPENYFSAQDATIAARKGLGASYDAAKASGNAVDVAPILSNLDNEIFNSKGGIKSGLQKVRSYLVNDDGQPETSIETLHQAKMAIDDLMTGEARSSMGNVAKAKVKDYQNQIVTAIENSPGGEQYQQGRLGTAGQWRLSEALDTGRDFLSRATARSNNDMQRVLQDMRPEELNAVRTGAAQALKETIGSTKRSGDVTEKLMNKPALEERVRMVFGDDATFQKYIGTLDNEKQFYNTYAEVKKGSPTAARLAAQEDAGVPAGIVADAARAALNPSPIGIANSVLNFVGNRGRQLTMPEPVRNRIAEILVKGQTLPLTEALTKQQIAEQNRKMLSDMLAKQYLIQNNQ